MGRRYGPKENRYACCRRVRSDAGCEHAAAVDAAAVHPQVVMADRAATQRRLPSKKALGSFRLATPARQGSTVTVTGGPSALGRRLERSALSAAFPHSVCGGPSGMNLPTSMSWNSGMIRCVRREQQPAHPPCGVPASPPPTHLHQPGRYGRGWGVGRDRVIGDDFGWLTMWSPGRGRVRSSLVEP
jgi:hypothetical protein